MASMTAGNLAILQSVASKMLEKARINAPFTLDQTEYEVVRQVSVATAVTIP